MVRTSAAEVHSHIHVNSVTIVPAISVWQLRGMDQWLLGAARPTKAVFHSIPSLPNQPQFHLQFHPPPLRTNKRPAGWKSFVDTLQTPPTPPMGFICWCRHFALANDFRPRVCIVMALGISPIHHFLLPKGVDKFLCGDTPTQRPFPHKYCSDAILGAYGCKLSRAKAIVGLVSYFSACTLYAANVQLKNPYINWRMYV